MDKVREAMARAEQPLDPVNAGPKTSVPADQVVINPKSTSTVGIRASLQEAARDNIEGLQSRILEINTATESDIDTLQNDARKRHEDNSRRIDEGNHLYDQSLKNLQATQQSHDRATEIHMQLAQSYKDATGEISNHLASEIARVRDAQNNEVSMLKDMIASQEAVLANLADVVTASNK